MTSLTLSPFYLLVQTHRQPALSRGLFSFSFSISSSSSSSFFSHPFLRFPLCFRFQDVGSMYPRSGIPSSSRKRDELPSNFDLDSFLMIERELWSYDTFLVEAGWHLCPRVSSWYAITLDKCLTSDVSNNRPDSTTVSKLLGRRE